MGPTIFLPRSQTRAGHDQLFNATTKDAFLDNSTYTQALLRRGDAVVMDARTLHCGSANTLSRRVLLYFTLRSPQFYRDIDVDVLFGKGSMVPQLHMNQSDFLQ
jgi:ectoine hydroxylase-related dioxygenase (phytanoyl-CoA dioxygenase family)